MTALKVLLIAAVLVGAAMANEFEVEANRPPRKGKKLVSPRVLKSTQMMPKHRIITVPKGDPRARPSSSIAQPNTFAGAVLRSGATTCGGLSGQCIPKASCTTGKIVTGLCPGVNYCCTPASSTPVAPSPPVDVGACPVYAGLATTTKAGNGGVQYQTVPIAAQHMVDTSKIGLPDTLADNTLRLQPTACAFARMAEAASKAGIALKIASGFRTLARQQYFWNCYQTKKCNGGNLAAHPGTSNHGQGIAVDVNTDCGGQTGSRAPSACKSSKVYVWLLANARTYGFIRAVQKEPWHWEYHAGSAMPSWAQF